MQHFRSSDLPELKRKQLWYQRNQNHPKLAVKQTRCDSLGFAAWNSLWELSACAAEFPDLPVLAIRKIDEKVASQLLVLSIWLDNFEILIDIVWLWEWSPTPGENEENSSSSQVWACQALYHFIGTDEKPGGSGRHFVIKEAASWDHWHPQPRPGLAVTAFVTESEVGKSGRISHHPRGFTPDTATHLRLQQLNNMDQEWREQMAIYDDLMMTHTHIYIYENDNIMMPYVIPCVGHMSSRKKAQNAQNNMLQHQDHLLGRSCRLQLQGALGAAASQKMAENMAPVLTASPDVFQRLGSLHFASVVYCFLIHV